MKPDLGLAWRAVVESPLFGITLTVGAYQLAMVLWRRTGRHALANPVLVAVAVVAGVLAVSRVGYQQYLSGACFISFLLGPATVALALPLHRHASRIRQAAAPILACVVLGAVTAVVAAVTITEAFGGSDTLALSMAPKSATTPIAIALAQTTGGIPALAAVFTILTGVIGAVAGPGLLTLLRVRDQRVRGLAIGMSSHGIGTSRALHDDPLAGAFSGLAMAMNALATPLVLPVLLATMPWLLHPAP
ncbi:MAG TPA: LrgB family protein [Dermatophilaceae bacterium]|nr:LrgB family protein [Dermatophilaceae bacterium]